MSTQTSLAGMQDSTAEYAHKAGSGRLGLWLFIVSDAFVFGALFFTRFYLLGVEQRPHLEQYLGLIATSVLLLSSFFVNRAEVMIAHGNIKGFSRSILATIALGVMFLIGVVGFEWRLAPFGPGDGAQGAVFYMMTGMHAFHVLTGIIFLFLVWRKGRMGLYTPEKHWPVEAAAIFWHFVDVVWIFFYPALYLIGHA